MARQHQLAADLADETEEDSQVCVACGAKNPTEDDCPVEGA